MTKGMVLAGDDLVLDVLLRSASLGMTKGMVLAGDDLVLDVLLRSASLGMTKGMVVLPRSNEYR